jgi:hypothetical protein
MRAVYYLAVVVLALGCSKEDDNPDTGGGCLGNPTRPISGVTCEDILRANQDFLCDAVEMGEIYLQTASLDYMEMYCLDDLSVIRFANDSGGLQTWRVLLKQYVATNVTFSRRGSCPMDSIKGVGFCLTTDRARLTIQNTESDRTMVFELGVNPDLSGTGTDRPGVGDALFIYRELQVNAPQLELAAVVAQRTLPFNTFVGQENIDMIDLGGVTYTEVISNDLAQSPSSSFKYYYSRAEGLVGYVDNAGVTWYRTE